LSSISARRSGFVEIFRLVDPIIFLKPSTAGKVLKTFYCGEGGWRERQLPDGTLTLTSPTGHTYTTHPGSKLLFPTLCAPTGELWTPGQEPYVEPSGDRGVMMPKRRHTRAHNRRRSIAANRRRSIAAERNKPPPF
jgi:hypothetical protein